MTNIVPQEELDARNIMQMIPPTVREAVIRAYQERPEYQDMSEAQLERELNPSQNASMIRIAFWDEYNKAQDEKRMMVMARAYEGVMMRATFYNYFLVKPENVAWMMCPPASEFLQMKADNYKARQEFSKILRAPKFDEDGNIKLKEAKLALDIYKTYSDRIHGAVIQRIEQKTQNIPSGDVSGSPSEIRKRIEELEAKQIVITELEEIKEEK